MGVLVGYLTVQLVLLIPTNGPEPDLELAFWLFIADVLAGAVGGWVIGGRLRDRKGHGLDGPGGNGRD